MFALKIVCFSIPGPKFLMKSANKRIVKCQWLDGLNQLDVVGVNI